MSAKLKIALSAAIVLAAASTAPAKDGGVPNIDLQKVCRDSQIAINAVFGDVGRDVFDACMGSEQGAHEQLVKGWAAYPALAKARCVLPKEYQPSYVEWLVCVEMTRDVIAMRKGNPITSTVEKCPVVKYREDGSIVSVKVC
jgi:hypothetical protein